MNGWLRVAWVALLAVSVCAACKKDAAASAGYVGTIVIGADYVQTFVTTPRHAGCPPRTQRAGECVKTPPSPGAACAAQAECVTRLTVRAAGSELASSASPFVKVDSMPEKVTVVIEGCGGRLEQTVSLRSVAPFAAASASVEDRIELGWSPSGADQICALWRWSGGVEVCCVADEGRASFSKPDGAAPSDVRLSRGMRLHAIETAAGAVELYQTAETANLL